jgi:glutathione peroxidase
MEATEQIGGIALARPDGSQASLNDYLGKVVLVVNVASKCGLTPQYAGLEQLYREQAAQGLEILGFPSRNFRGQEFDTDSEIGQFCQQNYGVSFPVMSKVSVAGEHQHPLYASLTHTLHDATGADEFRTMMAKHQVEVTEAPGVMWNFEKFLVSRKGEVVGRFAPHIAADDPRLITAIDKELKERG